VHERNAERLAESPPGADLSPLPTVERHCPVCATDETSQSYAEAHYDAARLNQFAFASRKVPEYMHLRLRECRKCDTVYASPIFATGVLAAAYRDAAYDSAETARFAAETYGRLLPRLLHQLPGADGALDVGAGDGAFLLQLLMHGFSNVVGVEPSLAPVAAAPPEVKSLIRTRMFDAGDFAPASLSLVTCFQTIEHLNDPLQFCRGALRLLRPGGALVLVGHNRRALSARVLGRRSPIFDIEHLQLFSPRSLAALLTAAGYRGVTCSTVINRYPLYYWARLFPFPAWIKSPLVRFLERGGIRNLKLRIACGNIAAVGFKPSCPAR
jgi:2-polyprenyl-3-methyl-5-hydroxy-6-metoxy-1,4-benzoquinol methylase